jgi:hypothetical protein
MEDAPLVPKALFAGAQRAEILGGLGDHVRAQLDHDTAQRLAIRLNIKENPWKLCHIRLLFSL